MRFEQKRFLVLLGLWIAAAGGPIACDDDDDRAGDPDAGGDADADTDGDADADSDGAPGSCPISGVWKLTGFRCGANDISGDWFAVVPSTTLEITAAAKGCEVTLINSSNPCVETERITYVTVTADTVSGERQGVTGCEPAGCSFSADDAACVVGDRAGREENASYTRDGDRLTFSSVETGSICGALETTQTYEKQ